MKNGSKDQIQGTTLRRTVRVLMILILIYLAIGLVDFGIIALLTRRHRNGLLAVCVGAFTFLALSRLTMLFFRRWTSREG
jgi:hypothetical protein